MREMPGAPFADPFSDLIENGRLLLPGGFQSIAIDWVLRTLPLSPGDDLQFDVYEEWLLCAAVCNQSRGVGDLVWSLVVSRKEVLTLPYALCLREGVRLRPEIHIGGTEDVQFDGAFPVNFVGYQKVVRSR